MIYKGKGGLQYDLAVKPLAAGGEGRIYNIVGQPDLVAKIYKSGKASLEKERKLLTMIKEPPDESVLSQIAWPRDVLYNAGLFVGFTMPRMEINEDLNVMYEYGSTAKYPDMSWGSKITIAENLCAVLDSIHVAGHTCGDFNPKNISVNPDTGHIVLLDTDSYHIQDGTDVYRCDVGIPEYLPAEIQVKMRGGGTLATAKLPTFSRDTDNFALAIHIFQLLMNGVHPFACAVIPSQSSVVAPQPSDNIMKGEFPFIQNIPGIKVPSYAPEITILPRTLQILFKHAFIDGHFNPNARPGPVKWHAALRRLRNELEPCGNAPYHQYYKSLASCPWCDVDKKFARSFRPEPTLTQTTIKALTPDIVIPHPYSPTSGAPHPVAQGRTSRAINSTSSSAYKTNKKNKILAVILSLFLGCLGVDRFYLGYTEIGILKLLLTLLVLFPYPVPSMPAFDMNMDVILLMNRQRMYISAIGFLRSVAFLTALVMCVSDLIYIIKGELKPHNGYYS